MISIGDIRVDLIDDCDISVDPGGPFGLVPRALWAPLMPPDDELLVTMSQTCILIRLPDGTNILADTGYGTKLPEKVQANLRLRRPYGTVVEGLARLGLRAADIHLVIDTHLHGDHCGGNTYFDPSGQLQPTFPNARYVVQQREFEDAMRPNERTRATYVLENYQPLVESGQMQLLNGDVDLAPGVRGVVTPGHTPGHMSVLIESQGQYGLFVCDMASFAIHFERLGWMTAYDVEPLVTLETKRRWQAWALDTHAVLLFAHDPLRHAGRFVRGEDGKTKVADLHEPYA